MEKDGDVVYVSCLLEDVPSRDRQGHIHRAGTEIAPVKKLGGDRWLIEIRTPEGDGFWYEQLEINTEQGGIVEEPRGDA